MGDQEDHINLSFKQILAELVHKVNTMEFKDMRGELEDCEYSGFDDEQVEKVLAVAVNEAIQTKVDIRDIAKTKAKLWRLLGSPKKWPFRQSKERFIAIAKSPKEMAQYLLANATQQVVSNLIDHQFDIRWNTATGELADYTFYEFCNQDKTTKYFEYKPRLAHVKATLYKECRKVWYKDIPSKEELCPMVYIRVANGWVSWNAEGDEIIRDTEFPTWINQHIRDFIEKNADVQKSDDDSLKRALKNPTLYWAVLNDKDFISGKHLKLKPIGKTQVYVGRAINGIKGRWLTDSNNHCQMMENCLANVLAMTTYDPLRMEGIQLVDARLALARVRQHHQQQEDTEEKTALFVLKTFGDDFEKAEIRLMNSEASLKRAKESLDKAEESLDQAEASLDEARSTDEKNRREKKVDKCKREITRCENVKKEANEEVSKKNAEVEYCRNLKPTKLNINEFLTKAEKLHREGKRIDKPRWNIIPSKIYKDITWKPKDMGYGMNAM